MYSIPNSTGELHKVVNETNKVLKVKTPVLKKSLSLYLANEETEHILFRPCKVGVHEIMYECLVSHLFLKQVIYVDHPAFPKVGCKAFMFYYLGKCASDL